MATYISSVDRLLGVSVSGLGRSRVTQSTVGKCTEFPRQTRLSWWIVTYKSLNCDGKSGERTK